MINVKQLNLIFVLFILININNNLWGQTCNNPTVSFYALTASCINGVPNDDTYLQISAAADDTHYNYMVGNNYDNDDTNIANATNLDINALPIQFGTLANPSGSQDYTIRVLNNSSSSLLESTFYIDEEIKDTYLLIDELTKIEETNVFHFISHGMPGALMIEDKWLSNKELVFWIKKNIDLNNVEYLNIYGCNFARGKRGENAVKYLEQALGVSVAASDNRTGIDGDWELEVGEGGSIPNFSNYTHSLQAYLDCATNLFGGNVSGSSPYNGEAKVLNGSTYMVWNMVEATNDLLGAGAQAHSGAGQQDIYIAVVDENCVQTIGTYSGGSGLELADALVVNDDGTFFISGYTESSNFPTTNGSSSTFTGTPFIQKYAADGSLIYSTILDVENTKFDYMEIISDGINAYLVFETGTDAATIANFTTDGTDGGGAASVVAVKLDATGNVVYASSVGGTEDEEMFGNSGNDFGGQDGLIVELNGCLYVQASTHSTDFPTSDGTTNLQYSNYLLKYDPTGNLVFSTNIYTLTGSIFSSPIGAIHTVTDGTDIYTLGFNGVDGLAIVSKHDATGNLVYQQVIPDFNAPSNMIYENGALYVGGDTYSGENFPATIGDPATGGMGVVKLDAANGNIIYASVLPSNSFNTIMAVGANGEVYLHTPDGYDVITTDGTSEGAWYFAKLDIDGNLSTATLFNTYPGWSYPLTRCINVENNVLTVVSSPYGEIPVTDKSSSNAGQTNYWVTRIDFCPDPPTITGDDVLTPATQMACANGVLEQILGEEYSYDGTQYPDVSINGIPSPQNDIELSYQWQFSFTNSDPWTDVVGSAVGQQQNYTPPPSTQDVYYRRVTLETPCCGDGTPLSTSTTVFIDIDDTVFAPEPNAGGQFYVCPNTALTIGSPPNSATGGQAPYTYLWSNGETTATPSVIPIESSIYTLTVTDANGCVQVDQANVTTYVADAGAGKFVCNGETATIGGGPLPGVNVVTFGSPVANEYGIAYTWTPAAGLSHANILNPTASTAGTYTLTTTIYQPDGSSCETSDVVEVAELPAPTIADFAGPDMVLCIGETTTLGTPAETISVVDFSGSTITQSSTDAASSATATTANLTDNDFTTGGHTDDDGNILIDLGSVQLISKVEIAALAGFTNDDDLEIELSTDGINFIRVVDPSSSLSETELTSYEFPAQQAQYIRFVADFSSRDVSLSEVRASLSFRYIWTPGDFISATNEAQPTFDSGNIDLPDPDPYTYTVTANIGDCNYYDQISVYVIEARAGDDGCGPRYIGKGDRTPNIDETYSWRFIPELTTGDNSAFTGPTDQAVTTVSGNTTGETHYELTTAFVLDGQTYTCLDTVIVEPCECGINIIVEDGGCADFDTNPFATLYAFLDFESSDLVYTWTPMEGLDTYTGQRVVMQDNVERTYTITVTSLSDPNYICAGELDVNLPIFATPNFAAVEDFATCLGNMIQIGDPADNPGLSYSWLPVDGLDNPAISNPTLTLMGAEEYTVEVTDVVTGCLVRDTVLVSIDGQQAAAGPDLYICDNATVAIGVNETLANHTYSWSPPGADWRDDSNIADPSQVNEAIPNVFVSTVGGVASSQTFTLTITSPSGCITTDSVTVFVNPLPPTLTLTNVSFCPSIDPVVLGFTNSDGTGTNEVPTGSFSYEWSPTDLLVDATIQNPTLATPLPSTTIVFELKLLSGGGCNSIATQIITPSITPPVVVGSIIPVCLNQPVMIGSDDNTTGTYTWVADGGNPVGGSLNDDTVANPTFTGTEVGNYTYTVTKTEADCSSTAELTISVQDITAPVVAPVTLCQGETGVVIGPTNPSGGVSYSWVPAMGLSNPNIAQPTFTGTASQNYTLYVINSIGCVAETPVSVNVSTNPVPVVSSTEIVECSTLTSSVNFDVNVAPSGAYSYQWTPSDFLSSPTVEDPIFFIPAAGTYEYVLEVTDQATGCSALDTTVINVSNNNLPEVTASALTASCTDGTPNDDGYLQISAATDATAFNYSLGSTYDEGNVLLSSNQTFDPATDLPLQFGILANPSGSQDYTIRVFSDDDDCFTDVVVTLQEQIAPSLTINSAACDANLTTYTIDFTSNGTVTSTVGTVSGNQIIDIPVGTDATITATLNACTMEETVVSPACEPECPSTRCIPVLINKIE